MIIINLFSKKTLNVVKFRFAPFRRLYRFVTRRIFLAAIKMAGMDIKWCAEMFGVIRCAWMSKYAGDLLSIGQIIP